MGESYAVINAYFDHINDSVCTYLKKSGYSVCTVPATHTYNPKDMKSMWSHRSAAVIAGLGTFGANRMLITPKGLGGRFCTVITSAALTFEKHFLEDEIKRVLDSKFQDVFGTYHTAASCYEGNRSMLPYELGNEESLRHNLHKVNPDIIISCLRGDFGQTANMDNLRFNVRN